MDGSGPHEMQIEALQTYGYKWAKNRGTDALRESLPAIAEVRVRKVKPSPNLG